jgi:hypothetical protein
MLIKTALANRTIRCRNMAVRALTEWPDDSIPAEAAAAVRGALQAEPDPKTRDAMAQLLDAWNA